MRSLGLPSPWTTAGVLLLAIFIYYTGMFIATVVVTAVGWLLYRYWSMVKKYEKVVDMFPGLPTVPFLGNALQFYGDTHDIHNCALKYSALFRRSFHIWMGPFVFIILQKPSDVEAVFNNTVDIKKARLYDLIIPWVQGGLLTSYGEKWKRQRKLLTPAFHFQILDGFLEIFHRNCLTMCAILEKKIGHAGFNVFDIVRMCALDNISETAMGVSIKAQENPSSKYVEAVKMMCHIVFLRTMRPWLRPELIFNLTSWGRKQRNALKVLHGYTRDIINQQIAERKKNKSLSSDEPEDKDEGLGIKNKKAFLDLLLDYYDDKLISIEGIQEEVDTFLFEGHDTITSALSFALYNLANNPHAQEKAYEEQITIFGTSNDLATVENLNQMKYLEMVIKESLRLCSSVPAFGRLLDRDVKLDEYSTIPAGVEAMILSPCLHRNPDVWENPNEFNPDRFLPENVAKRHPYSFLPFSAGPRNCIGMRFAMMEMKATLSNVVRKFVLKPCAGHHQLELAMEVVLQSRNGAPISLEPRHRPPRTTATQ